VALPAYAAPRGAGIGGAVLSPRGDTIFVLVRTPGAEEGATFDRPTTRWPEFRPGIPPRTTVIALSRADSGRPGR
jgi:secreted PhoX family phosphatase